MNGYISKIVFRLFRIQCCLRIFFFFLNERALKTRFLYKNYFAASHIITKLYLESKVMLGYPITK